MTLPDTRVVVALDFGVTFSTFAFANRVNPEIETNSQWPNRNGHFKVPTVLQYDENWNVIHWGETALVEEPMRRRRTGKIPDSHPVELFKLHLSALRHHEKPWLPNGLTPVKAITDYLREIQKIIKENLQNRWPGLVFPQQMSLVLTVPAEWNLNTRTVLRTAAFNAGLLDSLRSRNLEFTTEPEAAAIHCLSVLKEHKLGPGANFMVVDCGGGTVDITVRKLLEDNKISEITERTGDLCGSTFVDREFIRFLGKKLGYGAMEKLKRNNYKQMQYLVQRFFCKRIKEPFKGDRSSYRTIELDIPYYCPAVMEYMNEDAKNKMEEADWLIELTFEDVQAMFDPVIQRILDLIQKQFELAKGQCDAIFLVGGFSESPYLVRRVNEIFGTKVKIIAVPPVPIAAVVRGAVAYGLKTETIQERILKCTYGIEILNAFKPNIDKNRRVIDGGLCYRFSPLIERGTKVNVDHKITNEFVPVYHNQTSATFKVFATSRDNVKYCDEPGVIFVGTLRIDLPDIHMGKNRPIEFTLTFSKFEIEASARNKNTGRIYKTVLEYHDV
ncbi:hypothetical protein G9A89_021710 [Geosiphon pyriformis]|nr:hypothetical protein G9A89_021710 [Geosiphon pyriformis]